MEWSPVGAYQYEKAPRATNHPAGAIMSRYLLLVRADFVHRGRGNAVPPYARAPCWSPPGQKLVRRYGILEPGSNSGRGAGCRVAKALADRMCVCSAMAWAHHGDRRTTGGLVMYYSYEKSHARAAAVSDEPSPITPATTRS